MMMMTMALVWRSARHQIAGFRLNLHHCVCVVIVVNLIIVIINVVKVIFVVNLIIIIVNVVNVMIKVVKVMTMMTPVIRALTASVVSRAFGGRQCQR